MKTTNPDHWLTFPMTARFLIEIEQKFNIQKAPVTINIKRRERQGGATAESRAQTIPSLDIRVSVNV